MEDYIWIIWIVIAIGGSIMNARAKRSETSETSETTDEKSSTEPIPRMRPIAEGQPVRPVRSIPAPQKEFVEAQSLETLEGLETIPGIQNPQFTPTLRDKRQIQSKHTAQQSNYKKANRLPIQTQAKSSISKSSEDGAHPLVSDFDLERAVVYSEILKPKYQEYE